MSLQLKPFSRNSTRSRRRRYFRLFFAYNFRREVDIDVISGEAVDNVCMDVPIKFGGSRSNGFLNIRGADFVSNDRTLAQAYPIARAIRLRMLKSFLDGLVLGIVQQEAHHQVGLGETRAA